MQDGNFVLEDRLQNSLNQITNLMNKFRYVGTQIPFNIEAAQSSQPFEGEISGWYKFNDIYIAKTNVLQPGYAFCSIHKKWIIIVRFSFFYIHRHLKTHPDYAAQIDAQTTNAVNEIVFENQTVTFDSNEQKFIRHSIYAHILTNARPFTDADGEYMRALVPNISSTDLRNKAHSIATAMKEQIKLILQESEFLRPSIDEWSDARMRRYIGETIFFIHNNQWKQLIIALRPIKALHANAQEIANVLDKIEIDYEIDASKMRFVSDNCNTMLAVQCEKGIQRFPCILHFIHGLVKTVFKFQKNFLSQLSEFVSFLHKSTTYAAFCQELNIPRIPSFTITRWGSAHDTLYYITSQFVHISTFFERERPNFEIHVDFFETCKLNQQFTKVMKQCIRELEGDDFGTISKVNQILGIIQETIENLPDSVTESKQNAELKLNQFKEDYKRDLFPLIYVTEFLNPSLELCLNNEQLRSALNYIQNMAANAGYPINVLEQEENEQGILKYTDSLRQNLLRDLQNMNFRHLPRDPDALLNFWLEKYRNPQTKGIAYVALDSLSTLCNSASVEREFSSAGRILSMERMRLLPEITEDLVMIYTNKGLAKELLKRI